MINRDIIFVSNALANGGAGRVLCLLADHFAGTGYRVGVLVFNRRHDEFTRSPEIDVAYAPAGVSRGGRLRRINWIRRTIKQNPDASVVAFEYFVNIEALAAGIGLPNKIIVSERNDPSRVGNGLASDAARKSLYRTADMLVCQTQDAADHFSDRVKKRIILNPLKPDLPDPVDTARRKTVVTFCRLERQKNLPMLVEAFAQFHRQHPDFTLEIYGEGAERGELVRLISSLSLDDAAFVLAGRPDIHDVVRDCAMFVLPSDYEGLSNSMVEAMGLGLPTICTDCPCGGARMVINHGENGLLVPVGDTDSLVQAMSRIATDHRLAAKLSENARTIRTRLSLAAIAHEWEMVMFEATKAG